MRDEAAEGAPVPWRRYALTAAGLLASLVLLSQIRPNRDLLVELTAQRAASELRAELRLGETRPAAVAVEGPAACGRGARSALRDRGGAASDHELTVACETTGRAVRLRGRFGGRAAEVSRPLPTWTSVLPPLVAIFIALGTRRLLLGLVLSVWLGALIHRGLDWTLGIGTALGEILWPSISHRFRLSVVVFTSALVGMVNVTTRSGGAAGVALIISRLARGARSTRLATFLMGLALFFDDYANCIVVGTTMRPLSDRVRIAREKLAYLVDSTSAPIAGVALLSTWIGYEVSLFDDMSSELSLGLGGYSIFLQILPARFYCFLTLAFVLLATLLARDFGPMLRAERRAADLGKVLADDARPLTSRSLSRVEPAAGVAPSWPAAALPVGVVIALTVAGLIWDGSLSLPAGAREQGLFTFLRACLQGADGPMVLMLAALSGSVVALAFALTRRDDSGTPGLARATPAWHVAVMAALPLGLALASAVMILGLRHGDHPIWAGGYWAAMLAEARPRVILIGGAAFGAVLAAAVWRRRSGERRGETLPLGASEVVRTWLAGARAMALAIAILVLAWCIQAVCTALDTPIYLVALLSHLLVPASLPVLVFLLAAAVAFATGTSWGAMGILIPTVMPLAHHVGGLPLLLLSAGAVLDGAIFGDHCSPISDTTVMSSVASSCDHLHHVRTQLPYALVCMGAALGGYLLVTAGLPLIVGYGLALGALAAVLLLAGRRVRDRGAPDTAPAD